MSTKIMGLCWPMQGMNASQKAVLISLADNANDDGVCWPSIGHISERTCLSERAVQGAIKWLVLAGALQVSERHGRSTVYTVTPAAFAPPQEMRGAKNVTTPANIVNTPADPAPTPADPAPRTVKNQQRTVKEPSITPAARVMSFSVSELIDLGVDEQVANEFLALRKRKRAPLTEIALAGIRREAERAGMDLDQALRKCVERGWQGFDSAWVAQPAGRRMTRQEELEARNQAVIDDLIARAI